ncbi:acyltransferase family protein [Solirubrum puertoriconensis]|uniref:Acyltransferase 3 domain-containing protein n=1 Tax=Solirubrum puertoriconensis TaxID=1751427 RepID=A0A9X0L460_SOLP1|nr:acyltransferase [Solirubrum puertoriconensis]KUG07286.1 hypothetical protein ASU33_13055 [Solirubrum puertoriconensis]
MQTQDPAASLALSPSAPGIQVANKKKIDLNIEALRGLVALFVVWGHFVAFRLLDPDYQPGGSWGVEPPARLCVLIFFVLSGYVIGLTNKRPLQLSTITAYIKKRVVRIYPIYLLCLALALWVATPAYSWQIILSHLLFVQGWVTKCIPEFGPSWSLAYEILFYALFIPVSLYRLNAKKLMLPVLGFGVLNTLLYPYLGPAVLSSICFGYVFWLSGLWLSSYSSREEHHLSYTEMMAMILLVLSMGRFNVLAAVLSRIEPFLLNNVLTLPQTQVWNERVIPFQELSLLPISVAAVAVFGNRDFPYRPWVIKLLFLVPAATFLSIYKNYEPSLFAKELPFIVCYLAAVAVYFFGGLLEPSFKHVMNAAAETGKISYAIYLIHFPLVCLIALLPLPSGTVGSFLLRSVLCLATSVALAYVLERVLQPRIKKLTD